MGERDRELETIKCPACGANTRTKVKKDTALVFFPLYCQKCKKELRITWVDGKITIYKTYPLGLPYPCLSANHPLH